MGYQKTRMTCRRSCAKEAKATPTVCKPNNSVNRRLPKSERLTTGYAKCRKVIKSKASKPRKMTLNIRYGNGASIVVREP